MLLLACLILEAAPVIAVGESTVATVTVPLVTHEVAVSNINHTSATINWKTNGDATSQVFYDTSRHDSISDYTYHTAIDTSLVSTHSLTLSGLLSSTTYHYRVRSAIPSTSFIAISDNYTFTTLSVPTYQITDLSASNPTQNSVDLNWTTPPAGPHSLSYFDLRYSKATITPDNWAAAMRATGEPSPVAGTSQGMKVRGLDNGTRYYFAIKVIDEEGFVGLLSNIASATTLTVPVIDTTPPARITDLTAVAGSPPTTSIALSWTAPGDDGNVGAATSYEIRLSSSTITDANWTSASVIYNNIIPQAPGGLEIFIISWLDPDTIYFFAIHAKDEAGNTSLTSNSPSIKTAANLPVVTSISPTSGDNSQTRTVTINGTNFVVGANVVRFVSQDNTFDLIDVMCSSPTQLTAKVPKGAPTGTYRIRIINGNGTSELISVTYEITAAPLPLPVVTNLIPNMATRNTAVTGVQIFGLNLTGATAVSFGGTPATGFTFISDTKITADAPGLSAGTYDVKVTTPGGINEISSVKLVVSDPVVIKKETTEDTTTHEVVKLETNVIPVQITLTTDRSENATKSTAVDAIIVVVIPPQTTVTCEGKAYTSDINPPRVVKPDKSVLTDLAENAIIIEMGNPVKTINFDRDFVTTVTVTALVQPVIWYYNKTTQAYELSGKTGTKDGVSYVPGGTKVGQAGNVYTMGLLLDHMSNIIAGVVPRITAAPSTATTGSAFTIDGTNFHPTAAMVYFDGAAGNIISRTSITRIVTTFPTAGTYTLKVENPDKLSDTVSITLLLPPGGFWGGAVPAIPALPGTTDISNFITTSGIFTRGIVAKSADGICRLTIGQGTSGLTKDKQPLSQITMVEMKEPPAPPANTKIVGRVYDQHPEGAIFAPAVTLSIAYDPSLIPQGVNETRLVIASYDKDASRWVELDSVVDTEANIVSAGVSHFTGFAILGYVPPVIPLLPVIPVIPAEFTISDLGISPGEVYVGESVIINVIVTNTGGESGSHEVKLKINGVVEVTKEVTLNAGLSKEAAFTVLKALAGTYLVYVDGLTGSFTVKEKPVIPVTPAVIPKLINWWLIGGIMAGVVVVGVLTFFLVRRRTPAQP